MARPVWSGSISFGLVNVPVKAYTAVRDRSITFNQITKTTGARIKHLNVAADTGEPVERDDIELGYEVSKGRYVRFGRDELEALRPSSTKAIEVSDFVALEDVDPIYYDRTYWLGPADDASSATYQLLLAAMEERDRVAIGSVVMRNKQYLAAIRPLDGLLAMSTLRYADEVVDKGEVPELPVRRAEPDARALQLAVQIVDSLEAEWDPKRYHDTYREQLEEIIRAKDEGQEVSVGEEAPHSATVLDLMAALEASVDAAKQARQDKPASVRKAAAVRGAKAAAERHPAGSPARRAKATESKRPAAKKAPARKPAAKKAPAAKVAAKPAPARKAPARKTA